jgi:division/cell wall cluster transcriptional repressor MraZ
MFVTGRFDLTIDSKSRLSIPQAVRERMNQETDGRSFYIHPGRRKGTLELYPERVFERSQQDLILPEEASEDVNRWLVFKYSQAPLLHRDEQGRVLIPRDLLERSGIKGGEVTLVGVGDHLQLWSRADYEAFLDETWPTYPELRSRALRERRAGAAHESAVGAPPVL